MTALVLPRPGLWLPKPKRILRPLLNGMQDLAAGFVGAPGGHGMQPSHFTGAEGAAFTPELSYLTSTSSSSNSSSYTFNGVSFGAEDDNRYIAVLVLCTGGSSGKTLSCTIGGVSATTNITGRQSGESYLVGIAFASVPTGTSGTVVANVGVSSNRMVIGVWRIIAETLALGTPVMSWVDGGTNAEVTVTVPSFAIVGATHQNISTSGFTFTNATERFDLTPENNDRHAGADDTNTGSRTYDVDTSSSSAKILFCAYPFDWT